LWSIQDSGKRKGVGPQVLKVWKILKAPFFLLSCLSGLPSRIDVSRSSFIEEL